MSKAKYILDNNDRIKAEFLTKDNSDSILSGINVSGTSEKLLSQLLDYNKSTYPFTTVKEALDYLLTEPIKIRSFEISNADNTPWSKHISGEIGNTPITTQVKLRWTLSQQPESITVTDYPDVQTSDIEVTLPTPNLYDSRKYVLTVTDSVGNTDTQTVNAYAWWKLYYGTHTDVIPPPTNISDLLTTSQFESQLVGNPRGIYTFDCTGGKYIYFIVNDDWLPIKVVHYGLEVNLTEVDVSFTNESGGTYDGKLYRTSYKLHGEDVTIVIE